MNATHIVKASEIERAWYLIDAEGLVLGRVATEVASILKGKNKPTYSTNMDCGDYVIVINAEKIKLTGNKLNDKVYRHHTGFIGGLKEITAKEMLSKTPERLFEKAVKGMLPKNSLGREMIKKLKVYAGSEHEHVAQKPVKLEIKA